MNWTLILYFSLFLSLISCIAVATVYYIRHTAHRARESVLKEGTFITEGRFFKRFIPIDSREKYDLLKSKNKVEIKKKYRFIHHFSFFVVASTVFLVSAFFIHRHYDQFLPKITLTQTDLDQLKLEAHVWTPVKKQAPDINEYISKLQGTKIILVSSKNYDQKSMVRRKLLNTAKRKMLKYLDANQISYKHCAWETLKNCRMSYAEGKGLIIALPGPWDEEVLREKLHEGANILLIGTPVQLADGARDTFNLLDLQFENYINASNINLSLVGDKELTLGFDAGQVFNISPYYNQVRVKSLNPQALGISNHYVAGGSKDTRMYAATHGQGRLVWADFFPFVTNDGKYQDTQALDKIYSHIYRYLLRENYSAVSTWPKGSQFAVTLSQDTEDQYGNTEKIVKIIQETKFPMTWFALSEVAQHFRSLTKEMALVGEISCHGDLHNSFGRNAIEEQLRRIARCKKVMTEITNKKISGFRPPYEEYNGDTVTALAANEFTYYFAKSSPDRMVPRMYFSNLGGSMVSINRSVNDDYGLWNVLKLTEFDSLQKVKAELLWIKAVGGHYGFSFHSQFMGEQDKRNVVKSIIDTAVNEKAYASTVGKLSEWWRIKYKLDSGQPVSVEELKEFSPVKITVGTDGKLTRGPI